MGSPAEDRVSPWQGIVARLRERYGDEIAVVLVGSAARGCSTEESDVDFLVVGEHRLEAASDLPRCHVQVSVQEDFLRNLASGEDFEAWCVRLGLPLYDSGAWARIQRSPEASTWPRWQTKIQHGARRLFMSSALLEMGDVDAATEEAVYALGHVARGLLLKAGVFPLSRPELSEQVKSLGYAELADLHEELRSPRGVPLSRLRLAQRYSKKLLLHLDRTIYARCSKAHRDRKRAVVLRKSQAC
jgi:predicted nucleotidyltransferase/DNA-binding transcriptional ArsR family regulator